MALTKEQRESTLARFEAHRRAWNENPALRTLYTEWYTRIGRELPSPTLGPRIELGSGPGFGKQFIPDLVLTDIVRAPWHDFEMSADALSYEDQSVGALVLFDVLHHLTNPKRFFEEATRVLRPGGRIVMCEPYISPLSYPVYKFLHEEPVRMLVDPMKEAPPDRDPFDSNQAIPTLLFSRDGRAFARAVPNFSILKIERMTGMSYPASGGFSHGPLLPLRFWKGLHRLESSLPSAVFRLLAFRLLVVLERA